MPHKKSITVFVVPHNHKRMVRLRLVGWQVIAGAIIFSLAVVLFVIGVIMGGRSARIIAENRLLKSENEALKNQRIKIAILERELLETKEMRVWMEQIAGADEKHSVKGIRTATVSSELFTDILNRPFKPRLSPELASASDENAKRIEYIPKGLPVRGVITGRFGELGKKYLAPHSGIDISAPRGTIVIATAAGLITAVKSNDPEFGIVVNIDHLNGYETKYGHLSSAVVSEGQWVKRGDRIGMVGETGHVEGPHVHYEVVLNTKPIDPEAK